MHQDIALPSNRLIPVFAGVLVGLISVIYTISFSSIVYAGPLAPFRDLAIALALTGSIIFGISGAYFGSMRGVWWGNQTASVVVVSLGVAALVRAMPDANGQTLFATAAGYVAITTALTGSTLALLGSARLGHFAKFIPFPVVGGFLAATGLFLVLRAALLSLGNGAELAELSAPDALRHWVPHVAAGAAMLALSRITSTTTALILGLTAYGALFTFYLQTQGISLEAARSGGLLLSTETRSGPALAFAAADRFSQIDFTAIAGQIPLMLAACGLSFFGIVMSVSALEFMTSRSADLNRDLRASGGANILSGLFGGFIGYHSVSMYQFTDRILHRPSIHSCLAGTGFLIVTLLGGMTILSSLPVGAFAIVLSFLGLSMLWRWLVEAYHEMPRWDYVIVLIILAITIFFDFVVAVLVGLILASLMFTVAYSRVDVVRNAVSGRLRLSPTERAPRDIKYLVERGHETKIYELQGYLFFGTASSLFDRISQALLAQNTPPRHLVVDFKRVAGMDVSTALMFARLAELCQQHGVQLSLTGASERVSQQFVRSGLEKSGANLRFYPDLSDCLSAIEDQALGLQDGDRLDGEFAHTAFADLFKRAKSGGTDLVDERLALAAGTDLFGQGDDSDALYFLESGKLAAWIAGSGNTPARVATFLPGAIVGEIGFCTDVPRTARVSAESDCTVLRVTRASLNRAAAKDADLTAEFYGLLSKLLADRLGRTTALVYAMGG